MQLKQAGLIEYFVHGSNPKLLLRSGTHGNESGVIGLLKRGVERNLHLLPDFVFVPEVSPSAVALGTRLTAGGYDMNRLYKPMANDPEVLANIAIVKDNKFELCLDFHEDPEYTEFYFYDSDMMSEMELSSFRKGIMGLGISLFNGVDDVGDVDLGITVKDGYVSGSVTEGAFDTWAVRGGIIKRALTFEIPGKLSTPGKLALVEFLLKNFAVSI